MQPWLRQEARAGHTGIAGKNSSAQATQARALVGWTNRGHGSGCESAIERRSSPADIRRILQRNLKSIGDQGSCFTYVSRKGPHLQRWTAVTEMDRTVSPE